MLQAVTKVVNHLDYLNPPLSKTMFRPIALSVIGVTALILLTDCVLWRGSLPTAYVSLFQGGNLMPRIIAFAMLATGEEMRFRLGVMTSVILIFGLVTKDGVKIKPWVFMTAIVIAQASNVMRVFQAHEMPVGYTVLRYFSPGLVWGWLTWKHGWVSGVIAHAATHLMLQPILFLLIA